MDVLGGYFGDGKGNNVFTVPDGMMTFSADVPDDLPPPVTNLSDAGWDTGAFPAGLAVRVANGQKLSLDKGNPSAATLSYTAKTGVFKGSFKLFYDGTDGRGKFQHKPASVSYTGVMLPDDGGGLLGLGTGTVTINKVKYGVPVEIK